MIEEKIVLNENNTNNIFLEKTPLFNFIHPNDNDRISEFSGKD